MFGKSSRIDPLALRRQLLVAESELNRARLVSDLVAMSAVVGTLADRVKTYGSLVSSVALLVAGLAAFRRRMSRDSGAKSSWLQTIFKSAGMISTLWLAFRSQGHDQKVR